MRYLFLLLITILTSCQDDGLTPPEPSGPGATITVEPFTNIPSLEEMVVYQVNMRAMSTVGTFKGVRGRLDKIEEIGANVIWLMPIFPVGIEKGINSPYAPKDYVAVGSEYGTLDDLIRLVNDAHSRDIAVILDWVGNHTSWDHDWVTDHPDWYAKDSNGNMIPPPGTNWTDVVELDFTNADLRAEMISSMQFWLDDAGIDGFRCDAADFLPTSFWTQALNELNASSDKDLIWLAEGGETSNFTAGFEMNYAWNFNSAIRNVFSEGSSALSIINTHNQEYASIPSGGEKLRYITNHDVYAWESSVVDDFGTQGSLTAFVITAYLGGVPLIYDGQEVARPNTINFLINDPIDWSQNASIYNGYAEVMSARKELSAVQNGDMTSYSTTDVVIFTRSNSQQEVLVIANVRANQEGITIPTEVAGDWTSVISNESVNLSGELTLAPYEYLILKR